MKMITLHYEIKELAEVVSLLQELNNKLYNHKNFQEILKGGKFKILHEPMTTFMYSNSHLSFYDEDDQSWYKFVSFIRSYDKNLYDVSTLRNHKSLGSIGNVVCSIYPTTEKTENYIIDFDQDYREFTIDSLYTNDDDYESLLFQYSTCDVFNYNKLIQTKCVELIQPRLISGEISMYHEVFTLNSTDIKEIKDRLSEYIRT